MHSTLATERHIHVYIYLNEIHGVGPDNNGREKEDDSSPAPTWWSKHNRPDRRDKQVSHEHKRESKVQM